MTWSKFLTVLTTVPSVVRTLIDSVLQLLNQKFVLIGFATLQILKSFIIFLKKLSHGEEYIFRTAIISSIMDLNYLFLFILKL